MEKNVGRLPDAGIASARSKGGAGLAQAFASVPQKAPEEKKRRKRNPKRIRGRDRKRPGWRERRARLLAEREDRAVSPLADCREGL